ncbi:fluoride efflux transporter FluC [Actinomadura rubrisoli]|uniref:Fluoride-specific ion channel FluC n=1 Tax=Actinomadura rubrisoli TaxID=2530368 RepID=A0A4R5BU49_9ACTN|nr:CrcB family protein [Actinomadura rubrisoli]TDD87704.1 CrcB family protein [Actinomadura rubrisoli]
MPDAAAGRPVDPDVDLGAPQQRFELRRAPWAVLAAVSAGGVLGALARYGLISAFPYAPGEFPWAVFWINVSGCLLIGALMVLVTEVRRAHRLVRPFLGTGVLGGFTTFSTYVVDIQKALEDGSARVGLAYLAATITAALAAVFTGARLARLAARAGRGEGA